MSKPKPAIMVICENAKKCPGALHHARNGCIHHLPHKIIPYAGPEYQELYNCMMVPCGAQHVCVLLRTEAKPSH
jgi:hypothetical protein